LFSVSISMLQQERSVKSPFSSFIASPVIDTRQSASFLGLRKKCQLLVCALCFTANVMPVFIICSLCVDQPRNLLLEAIERLVLQ
jgi:hypothetical protein